MFFLNSRGGAKLIIGMGARVFVGVVGFPLIKPFLTLYEGVYWCCGLSFNWTLLDPMILFTSKLL